MMESTLTSHRRMGWFAAAVAGIVLGMAGLATAPQSWACHDVCGDGDGDGVITTNDALAVLQAARGLRECSLCVCDVDGSGEINDADAACALIACGEPPMLPCCSFDCPPCCGQPLSDEIRPFVTDCFEILRTSVGLGDCGGCDHGICDVDAFLCGPGSGVVSAGDALRCLLFSVQVSGVEIGCECRSVPTTLPTSTTTMIAPTTTLPVE